MLALTWDNLNSTVDTIVRLCNRHKQYIKRGSKSFVFNIPVAFDTETTNYDHVKNDHVEKIGWLYIWMFRFGNPSEPDSVAIYGRSTDLLDSFLTELGHGLKLSTDKDHERLLYVYVHNLGFDFEFIRDKLSLISELHANPHQPIYVRDVRGFEFRDSLILSGGLSLKKIGESLDNGITKKVGDLDYNLIRTPDTPLNDTELGYCVGDVDVLSSYIQKQIEQYKGIQGIPLTNTGRVRKFARDQIFKSNSFGSYSRYRELMDSCTLSYDEYAQCQRAFFGGFTHANAKYVGLTLENVRSYDFTSSYPAVMLSERFPMGKPEHIDTLDIDGLKKIVNDPTRCCIFDLQLSNVFVKDNVGDCYLSNDVSKVRVLNPVVDNGRIRSCDKFAMSCTDVDFKIISQCYDWDNIDISNVLVWQTDYLPTPMIGVILDLYNAKTTLKGVPDRVEEYQVKKGMLNSLYGMCVTRILRDKITVNGDEWITTPLDDETKQKNIEKNNNSKLRFLYYPWGVFITSYARFNLWTAIKTLGDDYIYSDTDSIKVFANSEKLDSYLKMYHEDLNLKFSWMLAKRRKFDYSELSPKTKDGKPKPIGVWDYEGEYTLFKTLGSKRYIKYDHDSVYPTVAGISPKMLGKYLIESNGRFETMEHPNGCFITVKPDLKSVFDTFRDGLHVPTGKTGKLASIYYHDVDMIVKDYNGVESRIKQKYGVHLTPVDFTLTMNGSFLDLIKQIQKVI